MVATITGAETVAVAEAIRAYVEAVEARDFAAYERVVAHDPDLAWYGSMPGQISGWAEVEPLIHDMFASLDEIHIVQDDLRVHLSPDGEVAWATCLWDFRGRAGDQEIVEPTRCTWVLERRDERWIIVHWHKSLGVA
jgi:ketosteroid isomerase-like protein